MTDQPASLAEALAQLQTRLPRIGKDKTAKVRTKTGADYTYDYANLASISAVLLPLMGELGLSFTCWPEMSGDQFTLRYELLHNGPDQQAMHGRYPLPSHGSPQEIGSAITYARRYCLCAVTGVAPDEDDDDAQAAQAAAKKRQSAAKRQRSQREPLGDPPERAPGNLPRNRDGSISRSQATDDELAAAGNMTSSQQAEHNRLARDVQGGAVNGVTRHDQADPDDPWQDAPPPPLRAPRAAKDPAQAIVLHFGRIGITDRDERLGFTARLAGRERLATTNDLTAAEGARVLKALSPIKNGERGALVALLARLAQDASAEAGDEASVDA